MKRKTIKFILVFLAVIILILVCLLGWGAYVSYNNNSDTSSFEKTTIYPNEGDIYPKDTIFNIKGVKFKMIAIKGGKICCEGICDTIELQDFYIGETEVTQQLWTAIMENNPSINQDDVNCPVENVNLIKCGSFIHKLDSISGHIFRITSYPQWLYVAEMGNDTTHCQNLDEIGWYRENSDSTTHPVKLKIPNSLGVYDMTGNVSEWTISGSDPLFFVMGANYDSAKEDCDFSINSIDHGEIALSSIGFRLIYYRED